MDKDNKEAAESSKTRRLTEKEWREVRLLWEMGNTSLSELAAKYEITPSAISQYLKRHGVRKGARKESIGAIAGAKAVEEIAKTVSDYEKNRLNYLEETRKAHYNANRFIAAKVAQLMNNSVNEKTPLSKDMADLKALRIAAQTLSITRQERFIVLDADHIIDETSLPSLVVRDLSDEEILIMQSQTDDDEDELSEFDIGEEIDDVIIEGMDS
jgi:predicted transcriptional regulator